MAFTQSGGSRSYIKYSDCEEGEVLVEGFYIGEETSKFKNQLYVFRQAADGSIVCLNAAGKLTKWINDEVDTSDLVRITYAGKKSISSGPMMGKEAHDFKFEIDLDHRKTMADAAVPATTKAAPVGRKPTTEELMDAGIL